MTQHLTIDTFLDVLVDMPDIEALQEIELRKERLSAYQQELQKELQRADLTTRRRKEAGGDLLIAAKDLSRLNIRRKEINMRLDRINWAKAVTAIYGQEGFTACREWMAMQTDRRRQA